MRIAQHISEVIGNTPLVQLNSVVPPGSGRVVAKVEYLNPGLSSKDRIAVKMIDAAEASGELKPGGTIVEPTSGNTGVGLALVAQLRGYRCVFVCPDKVSEDKQNVLRAYGAEVVVCPTAVAPEDPRSYYNVSERLAREIPGAWKPDQYANPNNPISHYESTGPELWSQTEGRITHFVAGVGTGGTISGVGRYLPDGGRGYLSKIFNDEWMARYGFLATTGAEFTVGHVLAEKGARLPELVHVHPTETVREAIDVMREYAVSQLPVLKAEPPVVTGEVTGSIAEKDLLDALFTGHAHLHDMIERHMGPP